MLILQHTRPHEVLKCYKRAQTLVEDNDIGNLKQLGDQCLSMGLLEEAAMYWTRILAIATVRCSHGVFVSRAKDRPALRIGFRASTAGVQSYLHSPRGV